jgi:hypothetical protein
MQRLLMETMAGLAENPATAQRIQASAMRPDWIDRGVRAAGKNAGLEKSLTSQSYTTRMRAGAGLRCGRYTLSAHGVGASSGSTSTSSPLQVRYGDKAGHLGETKACQYRGTLGLGAVADE